MIELTYMTSGEMRIPDLSLRETRPLGKYGRMRRDYLRKERPALMNALISAGTLSSHLAEMDGTAREQVERLTQEMAEKAGVNAQMKRRDPMGWAQAMNGFRAQAEEAVIREMILA